MKGKRRKPADPVTPEEWQTAVDLADALLAMDSARQYGLITGGPAIDTERAAEILAAGKARGFRPLPDSAERVIGALLAAPSVEGGD